MTDYNPQVDDYDDESDKYYLLAKQHAEANVLARSLFPNVRIKEDSKPPVSPTKEPYRDFTPKFPPVPTPVNADDKWREVVARLQRLEERALHGD